MPRLTKAAANMKSEEPPQITTHAFSVFGWAVKVPDVIVEAVKQPMIINAYESSFAHWAAAIPVAKAELNDEAICRDSLALSPRESSPISEPGVHQYLLVGLYIGALSTDQRQLHADLKQKRKPVGNSLAANRIIDYDGLPFLVVTPIVSAEQNRTDFFVLLQPKLGLCTPYHITQSKTFYLPIYREESTAFGARLSAWNGMVMRQAYRPNPDHAHSARQLMFKQASNATKLVLHSKISLQNTISCLAECFVKSGKLSHLQELSDVLELAEKNSMFIPPAKTIAMRKFVDNEEAFSTANADLMVQEISELWQDLGTISAPNLSTLKEQIVRDELIVEYQLLRPLIAEGCYQLERLRTEQLSLDCAASEALTTVRRILGPLEPAAPTIISSDENMLLHAITGALKSILNIAREFGENMRNNGSDQTMAGTLHNVWEKFVGTLDTEVVNDEAKLSWFDATRYLAIANKYKQQGMDNTITDLVEVLEKMNLDLAMAVDTEMGGL
jgi:hypothetical protein